MFTLEHAKKAQRALDRGGWSASRPGRFTPGKETRYPWYRRLGVPQGRSGRVRKVSPPQGFDPRTFQAVARRCTDYAIPAPTHGPPLPPGNIPGTHFCLKLSLPQGSCAAGRIMSMKNVFLTLCTRWRRVLAELSCRFSPGGRPCFID